MSNEPTVFVVDDDQAVRKALRLLISSLGLNVQTFASAQEFLDAYREDQPGCILLDVRLPGLSGLELQRRLAAGAIKIPIIFITGHGDIPMAVKAIQRGAIDFIEKPFTEQVLLDSVHEAIETDVQIRRQDAAAAVVATRVARLTPKEHQVMEHVIAGKSTKVIAAEMQISQKTVDFHRNHILEKLGVESPSQLVRMALMAGIT